MAAQLISLEYVVPDLDVAVELLVDHIGFTLVERGPHPVLDADHALIDAGAVMFSLLAATDAGDRTPLINNDCNLTQLIFADDGFDATRLRLAEGGASVTTHDDNFFVSKETITAVFGVAPTLVFTPAPAGDDRDG